MLPGILKLQNYDCDTFDADILSQGLILEPREVLSSYSYSYCYIPIVVNDTSACMASIVRQNDVAALIPPFNYNYQCGSVVLTSYIPVFIYGTVVHVEHPTLFFPLLINSWCHGFTGYAIQLFMPLLFSLQILLKYEPIPVC